VSRVWLWGPVWLQMALIFIASSIPNLTDLPGHMSDKAGHGIGYGLLGLVLLRALSGARLTGVTLRAVLLTIACATAYGVSDEFHQTFVPGRTADVHDVAADAIGATAAAVGAWAILKATAPKRRDYDV
jgi:VanZ family protein